jgi:ankyrin repeat protein
MKIKTNFIFKRITGVSLMKYILLVLIILTFTKCTFIFKYGNAVNPKNATYSIKDINSKLGLIIVFADVKYFDKYVNFSHQIFKENAAYSDSINHEEKVRNYEQIIDEYFALKYPNIEFLNSIYTNHVDSVKGEKKNIIQINVISYESSDNLAYNILALFTLGILPIYGDHELNINTVFWDKDGSPHEMENLQSKYGQRTFMGWIFLVWGSLLGPKEQDIWPTILDYELQKFNQIEKNIQDKFSGNHEIKVRMNSNASLFKAIQTAQIDKAKKAIQEGVDLNSTNNEYGMTALMLATYKKHSDIVKELIDAGANVNDSVKRIDSRKTYVSDSISGNTKTTTYNITTITYDWTALMFAVESGDLALIRMLCPKTNHESRALAFKLNLMYRQDLSTDRESGNLGMMILQRVINSNNIANTYDIENALNECINK